MTGLAWRWRFHLSLLTVSFVLGGVIGFFGYRAATETPIDFARFQMNALEVVDKDNQPLRTYLSADGYDRARTRVEAVDPRYLDMLIAYEDQRFHRHSGVDAIAVVRAIWQAATHGRIVSGASTLTMQTARLLRSKRDRSWSGKLAQMVRAWQLEDHLSKTEILNIYLTLMPAGGNREGAEMAARRLLGHSAKRLSDGEAALLIALARSPRLADRARRDDLRTDAIAILRCVAERRGWPQARLDAALAENLSFERTKKAFLAPHLSDRARTAALLNLKTLSNSAENLAPSIIQTSLDSRLQQQLEHLARSHARRQGPDVSVAFLVVENKSRMIKAYVGSPDFNDERRDGAVDMVRAIRSPGSALKPAIYALAIDADIAAPNTIVADRPRRFGLYEPSNFSKQYYGDVTLDFALRQSLNLPAVTVLNRYGPTRFVARLRRAGIRLDLPAGDAAPGLAVALGGVGTTLEHLVQLFAALADDGRPRALIWNEAQSAPRSKRPANADQLFTKEARTAITGILSREIGTAPHRVEAAVKTGTSYGFRDAWSVGYTPTHTIGVWVGRPDGTARPQHFARNVALPVFREIVVMLAERSEPGAPSQFSKRRFTSTSDLPLGLRYFERTPGHIKPVDAPRLRFPQDGQTVMLPPSGRPITFEAKGGLPPYQWLVDGKPIARTDRVARLTWHGLREGFANITVIDATGARDRAYVEVARLERLFR
ncbi:MAG: penicillin-binding protein 1C [Pseudomonadota bacterium]